MFETLRFSGDAALFDPRGAPPREEALQASRFPGSGMVFPLRRQLRRQEPMRAYSLDEIRQCFSLSTDFNEIFDVFQYAVSQKLKDVELYRILFWNHSLTADEVRLFGEKLAGEFPDLAYEVYLWLASVFEVTYASSDNFELALAYYQKASSVRPAEPDPYLNASDCYDPDLNIPPLPVLIDFMKRGLQHVTSRASIFRRLADLYEYAGDAHQSEYYRQKADEASQSSSQEPSV